MAALGSYQSYSLDWSLGSSCLLRKRKKRLKWRWCLLKKDGNEFSEDLCHCLGCRFQNLMIPCVKKFNQKTEEPAGGSFCNDEKPKQIRRNYESFDYKCGQF
jgi:hypothetical protein